MNKILMIFLILFGETASIYAEMRAAQNSLSWKEFVFITIAGFLLVTGYYVGYQIYRNIWIVSALSVSIVVVSEPVLAWLMFHESPTTGALIGFILGAIAMIVTLF